MKKYCFILDSGSSYGLKDAQDDTYIIPIPISTVTKNGEEKKFLDTIDYTYQNLVDDLNNDVNVYTAQPNLIVVSKKIEELSNEYEHIIFIPLSKGLSGFYNSLKTIESKYPQLIVVDSAAVGIEGNWLRDDLRLKFDNNELPFETSSIDEYVRNRLNTWTGMLIVADFKQLTKSGRVSKAKAVLGKMFNMKILIKFHENLEFETTGINLESTVTKALKLINDKTNYLNLGIKRVSVCPDLHDEKLNNKLTEFIKKKLNVQEITHSRLPICIKTHTGVNTFSLIIESK